MNRSLQSATLAAAIVLALGVISPAEAAGRPDLVQRGLKQGKPHVFNEVLVKFKDGVTASDRRAVRQGLGASELRTVRANRRNGGDLVLMRLPMGVTVSTAVSALTGDVAVDYVEPNWMYQHQAVSNDSLYTNGSLWGMYGASSSPANQYGSGAAAAWTRGRNVCSNVVVGVIDEGIYWQHEDLTANIWVNPFDAPDGIDNDGNGYIDDTRGWDFEGGSSNVNSGGANDDHGTHVAGTIGGVGGNGKGVAGVCWSGIKMISARFLGRRGGSTADAISAVDYLTDLKTRHGINLVASNNSWGGGGYSQGLSDAITRANSANILFVAAAGNDAYNNDTRDSYPSNYTQANVIAVASTTSTGGLSSFSQWGATTVDLGAPGSAISSTVPKSSKGKVISAYASYSGTSMATPHVAGAVAMYAAANPGSSAAQIKSAILGSTTPTPSLQGKVVTGGRLNVSGF